MDIILTDGSDSRTFLTGELQSGFSIFALRGADTLTGSSGNEVILGGKDNDQIFLEGGNDEANGNNEQDQIFGGAGNDTLRGGKDNDLLVGDSGNDLLFGDRGGDVVFGGEGADTFALLDDDSSTNARDIILDFDPSEGDRLTLLGNLTPENIVIREIILGGDDVISLLPSGTDIAQVGRILDEEFQTNVGNVVPSYEVFAPNGDSIAAIAFTTPQEILNNIV